MEVLLDTNFILTCVKQKLDFVSLANDLILDEIEWVVPYEVLDELSDLSTRIGMTTRDKESARVGISLLESLHPKKIRVGNKNVDDGIVNYTKNKKIILATLDKGLRSRITNKILSIRGRQKLELV